MSDNIKQHEFDKIVPHNLHHCKMKVFPSTKGNILTCNVFALNFIELTLNHFNSFLPFTI